MLAKAEPSTSKSLTTKDTKVHEGIHTSSRQSKRLKLAEGPKVVKRLNSVAA
jgi:hypothetical protein